MYLLNFWSCGSSLYKKFTVPVETNYRVNQNTSEYVIKIFIIFQKIPNIMIRSLVTLDMLVVDIFQVFSFVFSFHKWCSFLWLLRLLPLGGGQRWNSTFSQLECCYHWGRWQGATDLGAVRPELQSGLPHLHVSKLLDHSELGAHLHKMENDNTCSDIFPWGLW